MGEEVVAQKAEGDALLPTGLASSALAVALVAARVDDPSFSAADPHPGPSVLRLHQLLPLHGHAFRPVLPLFVALHLT